MAASDTLIGITGAVLLVGVMVGVFVYEYNSAEGGNGDGTVEPRVETTPFDGSFDPALAVTRTDVATATIEVGEGATQLRAEGNITQSAPGEIGYELRGPDGEPLGASGSGGSETVMFALGVGDNGTLPAGTYQLVLFVEAPTAGGSYEGAFRVTYESA